MSQLTLLITPPNGINIKPKSAYSTGGDSSCALANQIDS
jgi:hypothetical protein